MLPVFSVNRGANLTESQVHDNYKDLIRALLFQKYLWWVFLLLGLVLLIIAGVLYYFKIIKNKH